MIASTIFYGARDSAEALRVPCIHTFLHPVLPTRALPNLLLPRLPVAIGGAQPRNIHRGQPATLAGIQAAGERFPK